MTDSTSAIPFEPFARFERLTPDKPPLYCESAADPTAVRHNPRNPVLTPSRDPDAGGRNGLLTPQVFAIDGDYYMLYTGLKDSAWDDVSPVQSGLAVTRSASG